MIQRYIEHILRERYNRDVKSIQILSIYEYTSDKTNDIVFYTVKFNFIDYTEHKQCSMILKVDFHSYESNDEMYADFLELILS